MRVQRLTRQGDIDRVRRQGQAYHTRFFVALIASGIDASRIDKRSRIGVVAGKRVGGAVKRNRAKRLLREGLRPLYPHIAQGWDILLMARPPILEASSTQVSVSLDKMLCKSNLISR